MLSRSAGRVIGYSGMRFKIVRCTIRQILSLALPFGLGAVNLLRTYCVERAFVQGLGIST
jgi:hypothetical protein